jgi:glutamyl-tRNA reductase
MKEIFRSIGLSYKNAPVELREQVALSENEIRSMLQFAKEHQITNDLLIVSTCNRTEFHYLADENKSSDFVKLLLQAKGIAYTPGMEQQFENREGDEAVHYLFRVSLGLEAQVLGDMQIVNQVKKAYQWSADADMAGPYLHRLMHAIFYTNKRTVQETAFRDGAASISYAAAELIEELTLSIKEPSILIVGMGEIGADLARNLEKLETDNVCLINRTFETAQKLALECGHKVLPIEQLAEAIKDSHVVVSAVASPQPLITKELIASLGGIDTFKFFIDLSVPRSISPDIQDIPGAFVYNIDQIKDKVSEVQQRRLEAIPEVERIVLEALEEFKDWSRDMEVSPTIHKIKDALESIRQEELARYLKSANEKEAEIIDKVTKSLMQKIIKLPVLQLKAACRRGDAENLVEVLNDLFDLEKEEHKA